MEAETRRGEEGSSDITSHRQLDAANILIVGISGHPTKNRAEWAGPKMGVRPQEAVRAYRLHGRTVRGLV